MFWLSLLMMVPAQSSDTASAPAYMYSPRLGITHISLAGEATSEERYAKALALGAGWNRWPLYWDRVEPQPGRFNWLDYDRLTQADLAHGLQINAILLGKPDFFSDAGSIQGLELPIFADGSDLPAPGKALNPDNPWANFVFAAVNRYRPEGVLAQTEHWPQGWGIRVWEIWNEPDYDSFWQGSIEGYARLLKVAYIAAKQADPESVVMFGGLLYATDDNWLARVLKLYEADPLHEQFNWYMDQVAVHNYGYPWRSGWLTLVVRQTLSAYGLRRPVWLNESGVRVWDDYPGPIWAANVPTVREQRATEQQQASFFIQSAAYAWSEGADVVFFHQLFDDCGDQAPGTDFAVNHGELCVAGNACFGDAYGLFRNEASAVCFSHSPEPGTPRPAAAAYALVAHVFGSEAFDRPRTMRLKNDRVQVIAFERPNTSERVYVIWNRSFDPQLFDLPANSDSARLLTLSSQQIIHAENRVYRLQLDPAQPDNYPHLNPDDASAIGGPPLIVIEKSSNLNIVPNFLLPPTATPTPSPTPDPDLITPTP